MQFDFYRVDRFDRQVLGQVPDTSSPINGQVVVPVPETVTIDETNTNQSGVFDYDKLLEEKYQGILQNHPSMNHVRYDPLKDGSNFNTGLSSHRGAAGRHMHWMSQARVNQPTNEKGRLQTTTYSIGSVGSFSDFKVYWDVYAVSYNQASPDRNERTYQLQDPSVLDVSITNDGGIPATPVNWMETVSFSSADSDVVIRLDNPDTQTRHYLGGLAFFF